MNALVTGGAGFIASHICKALLREGHRVVVIDNLSTGELSNVAPLLEDDRFTFIHGDVCEGLPKLERVDWILHFASPASPMEYAERPLETLRVNSIGTEQCCMLAAERGARLLFASTSEVYGDPLEHPQRETYFGNVNPAGPRSCYDEGKRYGEAVIAAYRRIHSIDARIVRIFNTYGPRMRRNDGRVVPAFISQALAGKPFTIFGNGMQTRSLCYVDDLVEAIVRFATIDDPKYRTINVGNDREVTVLRIAELVAHLCNVPLFVELRPLPENDAQQRRPDLSRARDALRWSPATPLEEGLSATIEWFRSAVPAER
jgi:dTDP-glucose 4,6-dehydratase